jgi:hypothetical protein
VALLAFSNVYTLFKVALPAVEPPASSELPIPGFPSLGTIGVLSTFTSAGGLICTHLETVDTGPIAAGITPELLRKSLPRAAIAHFRGRRLPNSQKCVSGRLPARS